MIHQKILSKKPLVTAKWFTVNELEVEIKPGQIRIHHNIERKPVVYIFPIGENNILYLTNQYRYNLGKESIDGVAGFLDEGEEPLDAAKRELKEETGLTAREWKQLPTIALSAGVVQGTVSLFVAKGLEEGQTHFDEGENITTLIMPLSNAIEKVMSGEINIACGVAGLLMIDKMVREGTL